MSRKSRLVVAGPALAGLLAISGVAFALTPNAATVLQSDQAWGGSFDSPLFGGSVASAGDVNGDGYDDVIVGAPGFDVAAGSFDEGAAFIFLGSANGAIGKTPATAHAAIYGTSANQEFGYSVDGAGDINGDGYDDIIVGSPLENSVNLATSGAAYVFYGSASGITARSPAQANVKLESRQINAQMGTDVAGAGDVNKDGFADIIVTAQWYGKPFSPPIPNQGSGMMGATFVFLGSADGVVGRDPATAHAQILPWLIQTGNQSIVGMGVSADGAGDVNGDGYDDVIVGATGFDKSGQSWPGAGADPYFEGAAMVFHGGANGIAAPRVPNRIIEGGKLESHMGEVVAGAGDVNKDGFDDVIVSAPAYPTSDPLLKAQEGAAFVFHGSASGITATSASQANQSYLGRLLAEWVGWSASSAGDIDADGYGDIVIGARTFTGAIPEDGTFNGSRRISGEGIAYLLRGGPTGAAPLTSATLTVTSGQEAGAAGFSVANAGDVNRDGKSDLIVGIPGYSAGQTREGAAFVKLAGITGTEPPPPPPPPPPPNQLPVANAGPDQTVIDVNGDGSEFVTYNGSASSDPDGSIFNYDWRVTSHGGAMLGNTDLFQVQQSLGTYTVSLTVTDNRGATATDSVQVTIKAAPPSGGAVATTLTGPASVRRGATATFRATITNSGTTPITNVRATLAISPSGRIKQLSPGAQNFSSIAPGASKTITWTGPADREGTATATLSVTATGVQIAPRTFAFRVVR